MMLDGKMTIAEAAVYMGCSEQNIRQHIHKEKNSLPTKFVSRIYLIDKADLLAYFEDVKPRGTPRGGAEQ